MPDVNISGGNTTIQQCPTSESESAEPGQDAKIQALEALVDDLAARVAALEEGKVNTLK